MSREFVSLRRKAPELAEEWDYTSNGDLTPDNVSYGSNKEVNWICRRMKHPFRSVVYSRAILHTDCPYCTNRKVLSGFNDLASVYPDVADEWHPLRNGSLTPDKVSPYSHTMVWWQCELDHVWAAALEARTNQGSRCPYCAGTIPPLLHLA